jgi:hypothetical protein
VVSGLQNNRTQITQMVMISYGSYFMKRYGVKYINGYFITTTFLPSVLNRSPFSCTTVIVMLPVLLVFRSATVPDLSLCVPAITLQLSPFLRFNFSGFIFFIIGRSTIALQCNRVGSLTY